MTAAPQKPELQLASCEVNSEDLHIGGLKASQGTFRLIKGHQFTQLQSTSAWGASNADEAVSLAYDLQPCGVPGSSFPIPMFA